MLTDRLVISSSPTTARGKRIDPKSSENQLAIYSDLLPKERPGLTEDKVPSSNLGVQDLLFQGLRADIGLGKDPLVPQRLGYLGSIVFL